MLALYKLFCQVTLTCLGWESIFHSADSLPGHVLLGSVKKTDRQTDELHLKTADINSKNNSHQSAANKWHRINLKVLKLIKAKMFSYITIFHFQSKTCI